MILPLILPFLGSAMGLSPWLAGALGSGLGTLLMNPDEPEKALVAGLLGGVTGGLTGGLGGGAAEGAAGAGMPVLGSEATGAAQLAQAVSNEGLAQVLGQGAAQGAGGAGGAMGALGGIGDWIKANPGKTGLLAALASGMMGQKGYEGEDYDPNDYPEQFGAAGPASGYTTASMPTGSYADYGVAGGPQPGEFQFFPDRSAGLSTMPVVPSGTTDEMAGGSIYGPGKGHGDTVEAFSINQKGEQVPFLLQPGEYVMPKRAVEAIGVRGMDRLRERLLRMT